MSQSIVRRVKNGRDLVTYHESYLVPVPIRTVAHSLSTLNNLVASIMLLRESVDMEN